MLAPRWFHPSTALPVVALALASCDPATGSDPFAPGGHGAYLSGVPAGGVVVVANRGSGSISIIDTETDVVLGTIPLPGPTPEPMYVVHVPAVQRVFVGDRANSRVVAFDARTFELVGTTATPAGVFHMWAAWGRTRQLWVVNDVADTVTVIDPSTLVVIATVPMPADLVDDCLPHDTTVDPTAPFAYVSLICGAGSDRVVKFSTETFSETARAAVGADPHLALARQSGLLYVPTQNGNAVHVLDRTTLAGVATIPVPGAHGAGMARNGQVFYTTNLPGGGGDGIFAIDPAGNTVLGTTDTPFPVPHNVALTPNDGKLYLTHSGATSDKVTVYATGPVTPVPTYVATVTVGLNPFGLAYVR